MLAQMSRSIADFFVFCYLQPVLHRVQIGPNGGGGYSRMGAYLLENSLRVGTYSSHCSSRF